VPMPRAGEVSAEPAHEATPMPHDPHARTAAEWREVGRSMSRTRGPYELYPGDTGGFDDTDWELIGLSCIGAAVFTAAIIFAALFVVGMTAFN